MAPLCYRRHRFPAGDHPARDLTVSSLHPELPRCRGTAGRTRARYLLRNGAPMGAERQPSWPKECLGRSPFRARRSPSCEHRCGAQIDRRKRHRDIPVPAAIRPMLKALPVCPLRFRVRVRPITTKPARVRIFRERRRRPSETASLRASPARPLPRLAPHIPPACRRDWPRAGPSGSQGDRSAKPARVEALVAVIKGLGCGRTKIGVIPLSDAHTPPPCPVPR